MSFLNSVLSSIDGGSSSAQKDLPNTAPEQWRNDAPPILPKQSRKRKAELDSPESNVKASKSNVQWNQKVSMAPSKAPNQCHDVKAAPAKPTGATVRQPQTQAPSKPPKKGSFAEIIARGQKNQEQGQKVGVINHKPISSLGGKKVLKQQKAMARMGKSLHSESSNRNQRLPRSRNGNQAHGTVGTNRERGSNLEQGSDSQTPKIVRPQPSYRGTAKANLTPAYRGTMKPSVKSSLESNGLAKKSERANGPLRDTRRGKHSDKESEDHESEGYDNSFSDDYSDMDAGFDDVEGEEESAARAAKKEDAYEQMMLEEMKRQKEARKRRAALEAAKEKARRS